MNLNKLYQKFDKIEKDNLIQNFIAQANSRYILLNTAELPENFPPFTIQDEKLNLLGFYYLNIGCGLAEANEKDKYCGAIEKGASILEFTHGSQNNKKDVSNFYGLIAALAYYVCFQYSKSFVLIRKLDSNTVISKLIYLFLKKDYSSLRVEIDNIIVDNTYTDEFLSGNIENKESDAKVYEIIIAKALDSLINFGFSGNEAFIQQAKSYLRSLKEIAELKSDPGVWWVIRLLLLITDSFEEASLWRVLNNYFDLTNDVIKRYIFTLTNQNPGIFEFFVTQRNSLPKVLNSENSGCVVSIPTSSGKTRIAEIAILDTLSKNPKSKVLYIAPFVSLAFEIENSVGNLFEKIGYSTTQLYGGNFYSKLDEQLIEESDIIIATPEKSKAILRGNKELLSFIKLVIIDEGHLLGADKRLIINEVFFEELRFSIIENQGKFLLLSAVLPNAEELAEWLGKSPEFVYKNNWRPSDERLGILEWTGSTVNIEWENNDTNRPSFNKNFIIKGKQLNSGKIFPKSKNEAVASTAYKFKSFGKVLIFAGLKASVFKLAEAYLNCTDNTLDDHDWNNKIDWQTFELACKESYGESNSWLHFARKGILCHNADLCSDVRLPLERLMRNNNPLVIISTSTLGQGVNLGVSTVIFSTLHQAGVPVSKRDFWNIAGRAGRAFVDHEGKILVSIDGSKKSTLKERNKIKYAEEQAKSYFNKQKINPAKSGILILIKYIKDISEKVDIAFDTLLQLISENKFEGLGGEAKDIEEILDWIDDSLLSLHDINNNTEGETDTEIDYGWVDNYFRKSLAYIQASKEENLSGEEVLNFLKARVKGIINKIGSDKVIWKSIINSGIPLNSDLIIEEKLGVIIEDINKFYESDWTTENLLFLQKSIEGYILNLPILEEEKESLVSEDIDKIRSYWLNGNPLNEILPFSEAPRIISKVYTYKLPWILNGIGKKLRFRDLNDEADVVEELSILIEAGLPNVKCVKVYQAGIRSRSAALEIGKLFEEDIWNKSVKDYRDELINENEHYKNQVSENSRYWLDILSRVNQSRKFIRIPNILPFEFGDVNLQTNILIVRRIKDKFYLASPSKDFLFDVSESSFDFKSVSNINGVYFQYDPILKVWNMQVENPFVKIR